VGEVASSNLVVPTIYSNLAFLKIMSKGYLYVGVTRVASTEQFESSILSNFAFSVGFCETYSEYALFASSKVL